MVIGIKARILSLCFAVIFYIFFYHIPENDGLALKTKTAPPLVNINRSDSTTNLSIVKNHPLKRRQTKSFEEQAPADLENKSNVDSNKLVGINNNKSKVGCQKSQMEKRILCHRQTVATVYINTFLCFSKFPQLLCSI
jgi:hypothetical protein